MWQGGKLEIPEDFDSCCLAGYLCLSQAYFLGTTASVLPAYYSILAQKTSFHCSEDDESGCDSDCGWASPGWDSVVVGSASASSRYV